MIATRNTIKIAGAFEKWRRDYQSREVLTSPSTNHQAVFTGGSRDSRVTLRRPDIFLCFLCGLL
jgi:hypothetical protein